LPRAELKPVAGGYLLPFYEETAQRSAVARVALDGGSPAARAVWRLNGHKLIQPALTPLGGGRFRVYFRDQQRQGGYTGLFDPGPGAWSEIERTNLPTPAAAVDVFADDAGREVLIYNPSSTTRDVLALARSDDGIHFTLGCQLSVPGDGPAAYPSVVRGRD